MHRTLLTVWRVRCHLSADTSYLKQEHIPPLPHPRCITHCLPSGESGAISPLRLKFPQVGTHLPPSPWVYNTLLTVWRVRCHLSADTSSLKQGHQLPPTPGCITPCLPSGESGATCPLTLDPSSRRIISPPPPSRVYNTLLTVLRVRCHQAADTSSLKQALHVIFLFVLYFLFHDLHCSLSRQQRAVQNVEYHAFSFRVAFGAIFRVVGHEECVTARTSACC